MRKWKCSLFTILVVLLFITACHKTDKIADTLGDDSLIYPSITNELEKIDSEISNISIAPTEKITQAVTNPVSEITPTMGLGQENDKRLTFDVEPIPSQNNMPIPYMTREEFPSIDGSTANIPLGEELYCFLTGASKEEAKLNLKFNKTPDSYRKLMNKEADILLVYEPSQIILQELQDANAELLFKPLGRDALVFLANESNPVNSLTRQQIIDIYTGITTKWSEVGGNNTEILPFQRPEDSGSQTLMEKLAVSADKIMKGPTVIKPTFMGDLIDELAAYNNDSNALGYSVYFYAKNMYSKPGLKFLAIDGVMPTNESIQKEEYPYVNNFYVVIRKEEAEQSKARLIYDWLTTMTGQELVVRAGYVPVISVRGTDDIGQKESSIIKKVPFNIKKDEYIIIHDTSSEEVIIGDILLNRELEPVLSFPGKEIITNGNLLCSLSDTLILKSVITEERDYGNGITMYKTYGYELYDLKTQSYITKQPYSEIQKTEYGMYVCKTEQSEGIYLIDIYNSKGDLVFTKSYKTGLNDPSITVVKNHVILNENNKIMVFRDNGTQIASHEFKYKGYFWDIRWLGDELTTDYAYFKTENNNTMLIIDEDGNVISDEPFLINITFIHNKPKTWITSMGQTNEGMLIIAGHLNGHYIVVREDGKILFDEEVKKDVYYSNILAGGICLYNGDKGKNFYLTIDGEMIGSDENQQILRMNDSIVKLHKGGFTVYNLNVNEHYRINSENYTTDYFVSTEYINLPEFFRYKTINSNGEEEILSSFKDVKAFQGNLNGYYVGENYYKVWNEGRNFIMDKKGKEYYHALENETILGIIEGKELYVYVRKGNYVSIKDLKGEYVYRQYSSDLSDD